MSENHSSPECMETCPPEAASFPKVAWNPEAQRYFLLTPGRWRYEGTVYLGLYWASDDPLVDGWVGTESEDPRGFFAAAHNPVCEEEDAENG